jgi:protein-tyrosine phosphatase
LASARRIDDACRGYPDRLVIDLHSHVLPGIDDGAEDLAEAIEICRAAAADGITAIAATPHVRDDYPTTPEAMEDGVRALQAAVGNLIQVLPGGEIDLQELDRPLEELARFGLGGNPRFLLVEMPYLGWPLDLEQRLSDLRAAGITPVLAHPERNADVQAQPARLEAVVAGGALVQLTAASVDGRLGRNSERCARSLLKQGCAHLVASDAHAPSVRAVGMAGAARAVNDVELARWLTVDVPWAIVRGNAIPRRPEPAKRRRLRIFGG